MQVVRTIIASQLILLAMEGELTFLDTVAIATDQYAQEWFWRIDDILDVVMTLDKICIVAILVRHHDCYNRTTVVCYCNFVALLVL